MAIFITGDTHGDFSRIEAFCKANHTSRDDVIIILGDAGINYYGGQKDQKTKEYLSQIPIKFFCIHGNHEKRPASLQNYTLCTWNGGNVYIEYEYPNIMFAKDGEIYNIDNQQCIVIGGAYSVDKWWRLQQGFAWFSDEQPDKQTKQFVEAQLTKKKNTLDVVLSHTVPFDYMPTDMFLEGLDQSLVDNSTEMWLNNIESRLEYKWWYAGHFHCDRINKKLQIMFNDIEPFGNFLTKLQ